METSDQACSSSAELEHKSVPWCRESELLMQIESSISRTRRNLERRKAFEANCLSQLESLSHTATYLLDNESRAKDLVAKTLVIAYQTEQCSAQLSNNRTGLFRIIARLFMSDAHPLPDRFTASDRPDEAADDDLHTRLHNHYNFNHYYYSDNLAPLHFPSISEDNLKKSLQTLPHELRLAIVLSLLEGLSYQEIAEITGASLQLVRSRLSRGRKLMQRQLLDHAQRREDSDILTSRVRRTATG